MCGTVEESLRAKNPNSIRPVACEGLTDGSTHDDNIYRAIEIKANTSGGTDQVYALGRLSVLAYGCNWIVNGLPARAPANRTTQTLATYH